MAVPDFPDRGILWQGWNDDTLRIINDRQQPVLLFVRDDESLVWPLLREIFKAMPKNVKLRNLLHVGCPALYIEAAALPEQLKALGAGSRYHIAILSPSGLTPMVTVDPAAAKPADIVDHIVLLLERVLEAWR